MADATPLPPFAEPRVFEPRMADWDGRARRVFAAQGLMSHLGARIAELAPGRCVLATEFAPHLAQQNGFFHAGVTSALADTAGGFAAYTLFAEDANVLTVEFKINLIAPAAGSRMYAVANVIRSGRSLTTCQVDVDVETPVGRKACAVMLMTLIAIEAPLTSRRRSGPARACAPDRTAL
jgi:uncharacterized protein (TIGR00369 family)